MGLILSNFFDMLDQTYVRKANAIWRGIFYKLTDRDLWYLKYEQLRMNSLNYLSISGLFKKTQNGSRSETAIYLFASVGRFLVWGLTAADVLAAISKKWFLL